MTRVLALDLDETLLNSQSEVSLHNLMMLRAWQEAGNRIVIATGRPPRSIGPVLPDELHTVPWIGYNGADIRHEGEILYQNSISVQDTRQIIELLEREYPKYHVRLEVNNHVLTKKPISYYDPSAYTIVERLDVVDQPCAKVLFWADKLTGLDALIEGLPPSAYALISEKYSLVQIMSRTADKSEALAFLLEGWGLTLADAIAIGDDVNDVEMVRRSGLGVAVENAVDEVKEVADHVTKSNDDHGVGAVITDLLAGVL